MSSRGEYRRDERERGRGERTRERHSRSERHRDEPRRRRSSRSHSPRDRRGPDRRDYRRDRDRDRDRDSERYRERAREREQGGRKKEEKPAVQTDEPEEGEEMEAANEDTEAMMTAMGMAAFASTKVTLYTISFLHFQSFSRENMSPAIKRAPPMSKSLAPGDNT